MSLSLAIDSNRRDFAPGEEVEVHAEWSLSRAPDTLEVRLVWHTSGKGDRDLGVAKTIEIASPAAIGNQRLAILLPNGPYSFSGKLISLLWGMELVALPNEESTRIDFTLGPDCREVLIGEARKI